ncbi:MAG: hypothetical protein L0H10_19445 [Comamonas sp.]|nr:hypothetical protein [Comamonas sp.]
MLTLVSGVFVMSKLALALRLQGKIAGFGKAREQGRPSGAGVACESAQFLSSVQPGLPPAGAQLYLGWVASSDGLSVCSISPGISEKIATISAATIVVIAIAFITIIFGELAQSVSASSIQSWFRHGKVLHGPGCVYRKVLCEFVVIFNACHIDFAAD